MPHSGDYRIEPAKPTPPVVPPVAVEPPGPNWSDGWPEKSPEPPPIAVTPPPEQAPPKAVADVVPSAQAASGPNLNGGLGDTLGGGLLGAVPWSTIVPWALSGGTFGAGTLLGFLWGRRGKLSRLVTKPEGDNFVPVDAGLQQADQQAQQAAIRARPSADPTIKAFVKERDKIVRDVRFVPYETDAFGIADQQAMAEFGTKYPGAVGVLEWFKGMRQHILNAT